MSAPTTLRPSAPPDVDDVPAPPPGPLSRLLLGGIHLYQLLRSGRPTGCRYLPTCSEYAIEAISTHGTAKGSLLALRRLSRCTPWGGHGIDPVPTGRTSCTHR